jgi:TfdA family taurine catabolism dioxygenase TauD
VTAEELTEKPYQLSLRPSSESLRSLTAYAPIWSQEVSEQLKTVEDVKPWKWLGPDSSAHVLEQFNRDGLCRIRMPEAIEIARHDPAALVELLFGRPALLVVSNSIKIKVGDRLARSYAVTGQEAVLHIDPHAYLPPHLQILICVKQASDSGGNSFFADTWSLLARLKAAKSELLDRFLSEPRMIRFPSMIWFSPTFSMRTGNFLCVHSPFPGDSAVGKLFLQEINNHSLARFRLEDGEISVNNNHRHLHGRTAFQDPNRHLIRVVAWFDEPFAAPAEYLESTSEMALRTETLAAEFPMWIRKRLGLSGRLAGFEKYSKDDLRYNFDGSVPEPKENVEELIAAYTQICGLQSAMTPSA